MINGPVLTAYMPGGTGSNSGFNLSAAANWLDLSFIAKGKTLSAIRAYVSAVTGSPTAADITAHLQIDAAGVPSGTTIESRAIDSISVGMHNFSGFTTALTDGQRYHIVFKNGHATPASNFVTMRTVSSRPAELGGGQSFWSWTRRTTTTSGSSWAGTIMYHGMRIDYSDSTYDGVPFIDSVVAPTADGIFADREVGTWFRLGPNTRPRVIGLSFVMASNVGTPTGNLRARLYSGSTPSLVATSHALNPIGAMTGETPLEFFFSSPQELTADEIYRAVLSETTQSDTGSNRYNQRVYLIDNDATSKAMIGFSGNGLQKTVYDGIGWLEDDTQFVPFALLLDPAQSFASLSGGGAGASIFGGTVIR